MRFTSAALLILLVAPAAAQEEPAARVAPERDPVVIVIRDRLRSDPAFADSVAERVVRSQLIGQLTTDPGLRARMAAAAAWIQSDPDAAAHVALGLASDDAAGTTAYEDALLRQFARTYVPNPGAERNTFFRLRKSATDSKLLQKQSQELSADEKNEILRTLFEGKGDQKHVLLTPQGDKASNQAASTTVFNGYYDRLSAGNAGGYSPRVLALQSALNARRPPGAPALVETGRLDYATLSYPAYAVSYDMKNLQSRLRRDRLLALARLAGLTISASDWQDPTLEAKLAAHVPADKIPSRLRHRAALLKKAQTALSHFSTSAEKSKAPEKITSDLLVDLSGKQKEAARWITAAALAEELSRLDELDGFPTAELLAAIDAVPASAPERAEYKRRGEELKARITRMKSNAGKALSLLESDGWTGAMAAVDRLKTENAGMRSTLDRDVDDFSRVPHLIVESLWHGPRWLRILNDLAVRWAPFLPYSRAVARRRERFILAMTAFGQIASGDMNAADATISVESAGR